jgi:hypothetical protein
MRMMHERIGRPLQLKQLPTTVGLTWLVSGGTERLSPKLVGPSRSYPYDQTVSTLSGIPGWNTFGHLNNPIPLGLRSMHIVLSAFSQILFRWVHFTSENKCERLGVVSNPSRALIPAVAVPPD